ncbi:MAG: serine/threonine-protein kinase [Myxococcota bacterium]
MKHDKSMTAPLDAFPAGTRLARRYVVRELLGDGGMAQIYRAEHETIGRPVAIKVLGARLARRPVVMVRFLQEARAASKVRHENVVEITDFGETEDGRPFMVMELLEGEDLGTTLRREGPLPWARAKPILVQVLAALEVAHAHGVIHRDIKPENIFRVSRMGSDDFIKVFDFGIAKILVDDEGGPTRPLTVDGVVLGTPAYMSPEQCLSRPIDARTDLYAVGVLAYEMLTGRPPFVGQASASLMFQHIYNPIPAMAQAAPEIRIGAEVEAIVGKALAKLPEDRFASARQMADALGIDPPGEPEPRRPGLRNLFRRWR